MYDKNKKLNGNQLVNSDRLITQDCIAGFVCETATRQCYMGDCVTCSTKGDGLKRQIADAFEEDFVDEVAFKQWTNTDRSQLELQSLAVEEFVELIVSSLLKLKKHFFINQQQQAAIRRRKEELQVGEVIHYPVCICM